jgi:putative CocE/NonD family hydrolase
MSDQIEVEFDAPAEMRDGTILRANIFRPRGDGAYPVALSRTPYGKDFASVHPFGDAVRLARAGYIVVLQDVRGRFRSDGEWKPFYHEHDDGYDTVEWAARLPGSNGKVGMFGLSYLGFTQWMAAMAAPPSLKAIVPALTWADMRDGVAWRGGAWELGTQASWYLTASAFDVLLKRLRDAPPEQQARELGLLVQEIDRLRTEGYFSLPLKDFEPLKRLGLAEDLEELIENAENPDHYAPFSIARHYRQVQVPSLNVGGWYDIFTGGTLRNFSAMRADGATPAARQSKLLVGPWSHASWR